MTYGRIRKVHAEAYELRRKAGAYLRQCRENAELTQNKLAQILGFEYYTMISQVEGGKTRLPPAQLVAWAEAVKEEPRVFAKTLLRYYDPFMWDVLFGDGGMGKSEQRPGDPG